MRIYLYGALILVVAVVAGLVFLPTAYVMVQVAASGMVRCDHFGTGFSPSVI